MDRRDAILKAAKELFAQRGFHATTTCEVAKRADVAEGTIFHHFTSKRGIFIHLLEEMRQLYVSGTRARVDKVPTGLEAIEELIRFHFEFSRKNSNDIKMLIRDFPPGLMEERTPFRKLIAKGMTELTALVEESLERGVQDGTIKDIPIQETAFILRGLLDGLSRLQFFWPVTVTDLRSQAIEFCRRSLAARSVERGDHDGPKNTY